jgi:hypothetical protein
MEMLYIFSVILLGIAMVLLFWRFEQWRFKPFSFPYVARQYIYSMPERKFLGYLIRAVGEDYLIMGKVR